MRRTLTLSAVAVLGALSACGKTPTADRYSTGAGGDGTPISGSGGAGGGGAAGPGSGPSTSGAGGAPAVCPSATGIYTAQESPSNVLFLYDRSGSMYLTVGSTETRWDAMKAGFFTLLDGLSSDVSAGLTMFPSGDAPVTCCRITLDNDIDCSACAAGELPGTTVRCDAGTYGAPAISVASLDAAQVSAIESEVSLSDGAFYWGTPMAPAFEGAISYMQGQNFPGISSIILMTDGNPTSCDTSSDPGANDIQRVITAVSTGLNASNPIRTFVMGIIDGSQGVLGASEANLSQLATAGGTARYPGCEQSNDCAYYVNTGSFEADLKSALDAIALEAFSCTFDVPQVQGGAPDYNAVNITITANNQTSTIARDTSHASGWDYLPGYEQLQLYGDSCKLMKGDAGAELQVVVGCQTIMQ